MPELSEDMQAIHTRACHNVKRWSAKSCEVGKVGEQMKQRSKYNSKKCEYDGIVFASKDELIYYKYLLEQVSKGIVEKFYLQPKFILKEKYEYFGMKRREITYTPDFHVIYSNGDEEYIDVKSLGTSTQQGELRRKLFEIKYNDLFLRWVCHNKKHGIDGWVEYETLKKIYAKNKRGKINV